MRHLAIGTGLVLVIAFTFACAAAAANITVVTGADAPALEKLAASELCSYLDKLFGAQTETTHSIPLGAHDVFLIGSPNTNPLIAADKFGKPSDQGLVLITARVDKRSTMIVGGGSPRARGAGVALRRALWP